MLCLIDVDLVEYSDGADDAKRYSLAAWQAKCFGPWEYLPKIIRTHLYDSRISLIMKALREYFDHMR